MWLGIKATVWSEIGSGILESLYMTVVSTLVAYLIGVPLGIVLYITQEGGISPNRVINRVLGFIVNIIRAVPFLILLVYIQPLTRIITGTTIGPGAMIVPLVVCTTPFVARMIESSLKEIKPGIIEAAQSMGSTKWQIVSKVLLPEAAPSILNGLAITLANVLGYSAMAGFVGGGGLGGIATNYGYYRFKGNIMTVCVVLLVVLVESFQNAGVAIANKADRRNRE